MKKLILLCPLFLLSFNVPVFAHGINFETVRHAPAVVVRAYFTRTSPVADAAVMINAPGEQVTYQYGRTDKDGYFAFIPNKPGSWIFSVDDETGHANTVIISISEGFFEPTGSAGMPDNKAQDHAEISHMDHEVSFPLPYRIISGVALIFGLTGILYAVKVKQEFKRKDRET
jgi:nickel transport protein